MRVSIVTAVLNGASTIERTIESIHSQGYPDVEHVVVDGGSTDGTLDIIRGHESRIARWTSGPDAGISDAFNRGVSMATGEVIGIISADDRLWPGALQAVVDSFERTPDSDVVYGNAVYIDAKRGRQVISRPDVGLGNIRRRASLRHAAVFVRRSAYERFGVFDEGYRFAMDYELILRFYLGGAKFTYLDAPLAAIQLGGVSGRRFRETIREARAISTRYGLPPLLARAISIRDLAQTLLKNGLEGSRMGWLIDGYRMISPRFGHVQARDPGAEYGNRGEAR